MAFWIRVVLVGARPYFEYVRSACKILLTSLRMTGATRSRPSSRVRKSSTCGCLRKRCGVRRLRLLASLPCGEGQTRPSMQGVALGKVGRRSPRRVGVDNGTALLEERCRLHPHPTTRMLCTWEDTRSCGFRIQLGAARSEEGFALHVEGMYSFC